MYTDKTSLQLIRRIERDFLKTPAKLENKRAEEQHILAPPAPATKRRRLAHPPAAQEAFDFPVSLSLNLRAIYFYYIHIYICPIYI